jgi:hypothetical protein
MADSLVVTSSKATDLIVGNLKKGSSHDYHNAAAESDPGGRHVYVACFRVILKCGEGRR